MHCEATTHSSCRACAHTAAFRATASAVAAEDALVKAEDDADDTNEGERTRRHSAGTRPESISARRSSRPRRAVANASKASSASEAWAADGDEDEDADDADDDDSGSDDVDDVAAASTATCARNCAANAVRSARGTLSSLPLRTPHPNSAFA